MKNYIFLLFLFTSCLGLEPIEDKNLNKKSQFSQDSPPIFEKPDDTTSQFKDQWEGNLYRNFEHEFRVQFPTGMSYGIGLGPHVVARAYDEESGIVFHVLVRKIENNKFSEGELRTLDIWNDDFNNEFEIGEHIQGYKILKEDKVYLGRVHAKLIISKHIENAIDFKIPYKAYTMQCYKNGYLILLVGVMPEVYFNKKQIEKYAKFVNSFKWEAF